MRCSIKAPDYHSTALYQASELNASIPSPPRSAQSKLSIKSTIEDKRTCYSNSTSSFPAGDSNTALISSNETLAISGARYVGRRYARKHAVENVRTVALVQRFVYQRGGSEEGENVSGIYELSQEQQARLTLCIQLLRHPHHPMWGL